MRAARIFITTILLLSFSLSAHAQQVDGYGNKKGTRWQNSALNLPDLTDVQKEQIKSIRTTGQKDMIQLQNKTGELKAKLRTLQTADKADMNKINAAIDEISVIKTEMAKKRAEHQQAIRSLLTEEQRVIFDSRPRGNGHGKGNGHGQGGKGFHKRHRDCNN